MNLLVESREQGIRDCSTYRLRMYYTPLFSTNTLVSVEVLGGFAGCECARRSQAPQDPT